MYRDEVEALRKKLLATEAKLAQTEDALATAVDRRGVAERLANEPHLAIARALLLGVPVAYAGFAAVYFGFFVGLLGLGSDGISFVAFLLILLAPLPALAIAGSRGLKSGQRSGWVLGVLAFVGLLAVFPPLAVYGLFALARRQTRDILFASDTPSPARIEAPLTSPVRVSVESPLEAPEALRAGPRPSDGDELRARSGPRNHR